MGLWNYQYNTNARMPRCMPTQIPGEYWRLPWATASEWLNWEKDLLDMDKFKVFLWKILHQYETLFKPFVTNATFLYPLKTSENLKVFSCFKEVEKGCTGNEWVKINT